MGNLILHCVILYTFITGGHSYTVQQCSYVQPTHTVTTVHHSPTKKAVHVAKWHKHTHRHAIRSTWYTYTYTITKKGVVHAHRHIHHKTIGYWYSYTYSWS